MKTERKNVPIKAIEAIEEAQKIAFAPFVFQATVALKKLKVLQTIFDQRHLGNTTIENLSKTLAISTYGLGVLLEIAESANIVHKDNKGVYELTKTGYFLTYNKTVEVNMDFTNDVCYKGLFHLTESIQKGTPEGLEVFGKWDTIYDGLSQLSPETQKSWFAFDHHYSDGIFKDTLQRVFKNNPKTLFDIGGNTGKFTLECLKYDSQVHVHIFDLPGQLVKALKNIQNHGFENRVTGYEINWLDKYNTLPKGADVIWMSQFLDCFSGDGIVKILATCAQAMSSNTELIIVETFTDRQKFDNAKFSLEATSLYFTALANGNSKMYASEPFFKFINEAGLSINEDHAIGNYHTMLVCKKAK